MEKGTCRICLEEEPIENFIIPCLCKGTSLYVHRKCLDTWRHEHASNLNYEQCNQCHFKYVFEGKKYNYRFNVLTDKIKSYLFVLCVISMFYIIIYTFTQKHHNILNSLSYSIIVTLVLLSSINMFNFKYIISRPVVDMLVAIYIVFGTKILSVLIVYSFYMQIKLYVEKKHDKLRKTMTTDVVKDFSKNFYNP